MKDKDLYIELMEFGKQHIGRGVTYDQIERQAEKLGYDLSDRAISESLGQTIGEIFGLAVRGSDGTERYNLEVPSYFHLLEHYELKEARQASMRATWIAIAAIVLTLLSTFSSIYFSRQPLVLDEFQLNRLEALKFDAKTIEDRLSDLAKNVANSNSQEKVSEPAAENP